MHWHAIRQSVERDKTGGPRTDAHNHQDPAADTIRLHLDGNDSVSRDQVSTLANIVSCPTGDDACDLKPEPGQSFDCKIPRLAGGLYYASTDEIDANISAICSGNLPDWSDERGVFESARRTQAQSSAGSCASRLTEESLRSLNSSFSPTCIVDERSRATFEDAYTSSTRTSLPFLQVSMPNHTMNNLAPFAYQRALRNRIRDDELSPGSKYDVKAYTPMFVHDCLMVPGSLAGVRGKVSAEDVVRRMTPALLPGFQPLAHATTHEPIILQSSKPGDHVSGMLVLGQSRDGRRKIHEHYRPFCKRIKVEVELDTVHPIPSQLGRHPDERWELRRRRILAHAWIWRNAHSADAQFRSQAAGLGWSLDEYLAGKHEPTQRLRIEPAGWIEDDRETIATGDLIEPEAELEHWGDLENEETNAWEKGSGGAAVPFDDHVWDHFEERGESDDGEDYYVDRGAFDRDYDRSGSAGCW